MSDFLKELCNYIKIKKINTTAYHPQTNGLTERFNAILCQTRSMNNYEIQNNWDDNINVWFFAYRASVNETTQKTTLYGREARFPNNKDKMSSKCKWSSELTRKLDPRRNKAAQSISRVNDKRKR
jgi:hypothetical protein